MKIGIITFHYIPNIGAVLQAYALCGYLQEKGFDCEIIDYRCDALTNKEIKYQMKDGVFDVVRRLLLYPRHIKKINKCQHFLYEKKMISKKRYTLDNKVSIESDYDILISGSDMIWDLGITNGDTTYFGDFVNRINKFAYASSGAEAWKNEDVSLVHKLLLDFKMIGVRESYTKEFLKKKMNIDSVLVCDPTLLLPEDVWAQKSVKPKYKDYVLVYFPYEEILNVAKEYTREKNKKLIVIENSIKSKGYLKAWPCDPCEWIGYIQYADAVFTDSYHGLLFSLMFEKDVWTANKGARQMTIIEKMNITNCIIDSTDFQFKRIDYTECKKKMEAFRKESQEFIEKMIIYGKE